MGNPSCCGRRSRPPIHRWTAQKIRRCANRCPQQSSESGPHSVIFRMIPSDKAIGCTRSSPNRQSGPSSDCNPDRRRNAAPRQLDRLDCRPCEGLAVTADQPFVRHLLNLADAAPCIGGHVHLRSERKRRHVLPVGLPIRRRSRQNRKRKRAKNTAKHPSNHRNHHKNSPSFSRGVCFYRTVTFQLPGECSLYGTD